LINLYAALASILQETFPRSQSLPPTSPTHHLLTKLVNEVEARISGRSPNTLNSQDISVFLGSLAKIQSLYPPPTTLFNHFYHNFARLAQDVTPQGYATILNALVRLAMRPPDPFLDDVTNHMMTPALRRGGFTPRDLSMCLHSLSRLYYLPSTSFLRAWADAAFPLLHTFGPQEISMTLISLTKLSSPVLGGSVTTEEDFPIPVVVLNLLRSGHPQLPHFTPQQLANTLSALAKLKMDPGSSFLDAVTNAMEDHLREGRLRHPLDVSMTLHSFAKLQYTPRPDFIHVLLDCSIPILSRFEASQVAALVSAVAMMKVPPPSAFIQVLGKQIKQVEGADVQSLATLFYGLACLPITSSTTTDIAVCRDMSIRIMQTANGQLSSFSEVGLVQVAKAIERWARMRGASFLQHEATGPFVVALGREAWARHPRLDNSAVVSMVVALLVVHAVSPSPSYSSLLPDLVQVLTTRLPSMEPDDIFPLLTTIAYGQGDMSNVDMTGVMNALVEHGTFSPSPEEEEKCPWTTHHLAPLLQAMVRVNYNPGKDFLIRSLLTVVLPDHHHDASTSDLTIILQSVARFSQSFGHQLDPPICLLPLVQLIHKSLMEYEDQQVKGGVVKKKEEQEEKGIESSPQALATPIISSLAIACEFQSPTKPVQSLIHHLIKTTDPRDASCLPLPSNLGIFLSALARLRYRPPATWMSHSAQRVRDEIMSFQEQDLSLVVNAWAKLNWHPPKATWIVILDQWLPAHCASSSAEDNGSGHDDDDDDGGGSLIFLSSMLWSLSVLDAAKPSSIPISLVVALADITKSKIEELGLVVKDDETDPATAASYTYNGGGGAPPHALLQVFQQLIQAAHYWNSRTTGPSCGLSCAPMVRQIWSCYPRRQSPPPSKLHQQVASSLHLILAEDGGEIQGLGLVGEEVDDGIHLVDLALSPTNGRGGGPSIGIEVDGPSHFFTNDPWTHHPTGDTLFKRTCMHLLPEAWRGVVSIPWFEWNEAGGSGGVEKQQRMVREKISEVVMKVAGGRGKEDAMGQ